MSYIGGDGSNYEPEISRKLAHEKHAKVVMWARRGIIAIAIILAAIFFIFV